MGGGDYFPMRGVRTDAAGRKTQMEVMRVDRKRLEDSRFDLPAGYKTVNMADLVNPLGHGPSPAAK
jgi:hypothetical protein